MDDLIDPAGDARAVLIAGPTASGKSHAALALAERLAGKGRAAVIVNADSMQVYDALRVLTARPAPDDEMRAPHCLFGHVPAETRYSVAAWLADLRPVLAACARQNALPILVGGAGLYFKALIEGLAATPEIPAAVRDALGRRLAAEGAAELHRELAGRDPELAASIRPGDPQRILRALEVLDVTGVSLANWRRARSAPPVLPPSAILRVVLEPDRAVLYDRIERRADRLLDEGAVEEVRALLARGVAPDLPAMKAIGVRELAGLLGGAVTAADALAGIKLRTRHYAKRQLTWLRNQFCDWRRVSA